MKRLLVAAIVFAASNVALALPQDKNSQIPVQETPSPSMDDAMQMDIFTVPQETSTPSLDPQERNTSTS
jgi:hypothetical protein